MYRDEIIRAQEREYHAAHALGVCPECHYGDGLHNEGACSRWRDEPPPHPCPLCQESTTDDVCAGCLESATMDEIESALNAQ